MTLEHLPVGATEPTMPFRDRYDAGRRLASALFRFRGRDVVVLGLPRGGVPVAFEVAAALKAPLDVVVVRKVGVPYQPELAMAAIGEDGIVVVNEEVVDLVGVSEAELGAMERGERAELERRVRRYRRGRARVPLGGRTAIVVDDGIATGATARAACQVVRASGALHVVLAVPVGPPGVSEDLDDVADEVVCLFNPENFFAVGQWYRDFPQVSDEQVIAILARSTGYLAKASADADPTEEDVELELAAGAVLGGRLVVPEEVRGAVVFAHGSGSSRFSPRNRFVAEKLNAAGFATLLFDLLTPAEEVDRGRVFDIELLASRLRSVTDWLRGHSELAERRIGYFGASTGAAAALCAAAEDRRIAAVVSRGGRPDLAGELLERVFCPTLLIVGGRDEVVIELNESARPRLGGASRLAVVPGATHLFEEPGALEAVAELAVDWFARYLPEKPS